VWSSLVKVPNGIVRALATDSNGNLYVGGDFTQIGDVPGTAYIAKWNSTTSVWSALGSGTNGVVYALAIDSAGNVYAGGNFTKAVETPVGTGTPYLNVQCIAIWNSNGGWSSFATGATGAVKTLAFDSTGNLYAGGDFTQMGGVQGTAYIAKWNSTTSSWYALTIGTGANKSVYALALDSAGNLFTGGAFTQINAVPNTAYIAKLFPTIMP
jgi:hypothetical protein